MGIGLCVVRLPGILCHSHVFVVKPPHATVQTVNKIQSLVWPWIRTRDRNPEKVVARGARTLMYKACRLKSIGCLDTSGSEICSHPGHAVSSMVFFK